MERSLKLLVLVYFEQRDNLAYWLLEDNTSRANPMRIFFASRWFVARFAYLARDLLAYYFLCLFCCTIVLASSLSVCGIIIPLRDYLGVWYWVAKWKLPFSLIHNPQRGMDCFRFRIWQKERTYTVQITRSIKRMIPY